MQLLCKGAPLTIFCMYLFAWCQVWQSSRATAPGPLEAVRAKSPLWLMLTAEYNLGQNHSKQMVNREHYDKDYKEMREKKDQSERYFFSKWCGGSRFFGFCLWVSASLGLLTFPVLWNNSEGSFRSLGVETQLLTKFKWHCLEHHPSPPACWQHPAEAKTALSLLQGPVPHISTTWACWLSWHKVLSLSHHC